MPNNTIHYSAILSLTKFISAGIGDCGTQGRITTYHDFVTCKECLPIVEDDKKSTNKAVNNWLQKEIQR